MTVGNYFSFPKDFPDYVDGKFFFFGGGGWVNEA